MKMVQCRDVGFSTCPGVVKAATEQELLAGVAAHAREAHGIDNPTPELIERVRNATQDVEE